MLVMQGMAMTVLVVLGAVVRMLFLVVVVEMEMVEWVLFPTSKLLLLQLTAQAASPAVLWLWRWVWLRRVRALLVWFGGQAPQTTRLPSAASYSLDSGAGRAV